MSNQDQNFSPRPYSSMLLDRMRYEIYNEKPSFPYVAVTQVHGRNVLEVKNLAQAPEETLGEADGMAFFYKNFESKNLPVLCIKTADCLPVMLEGEKGAAAVHAGWRGLYKGILSHPLILAIKPHTAIIGPHICGPHYEVGEEFLDCFPQHYAQRQATTPLTFDPGKEGKRQLLEAFPKLQIRFQGECTFESADLHSFRREKSKGRFYSVLRPNN